MNINKAIQILKLSMKAQNSLNLSGIRLPMHYIVYEKQNRL